MIETRGLRAGHNNLALFLAWRLRVVGRIGIVFKHYRVRVACCNAATSEMMSSTTVSHELPHAAPTTSAEKHEQRKGHAPHDHSFAEPQP
jgi:hypothetical protein